MELMYNPVEQIQFEFDDITCEFTQIGDPVMMWVDVTGDIGT